MEATTSAPLLALLLTLSARAPAPAAQRPAAAGGPTSLAPRIRTDLAPETTVAPFQELRFSVRAHDPDGLHVSLTLLNPPRGMVFDPVVSAATPATVDARWEVPETLGGRVTLVFEARDDLGRVTRLARSVQVLDGFDRTVLTGDVTGDGVPDLLATASEADVGGAPDAGALYLWAGSTSPRGAPTARLSAGRAFDRLGSLGYASGQATQIADVTGDGIDDVITIAGQGRPDGTLHVFAGAADLKGDVAPRATLQAPGANGLADVWEGQGILILDLTGDGVLDIVAGAINAGVGGVSSVGALYVYEGGARLDGVLGPSAVLSVPGAHSFDQLGHSDGQGILFGDVSGDGVLDLVVGAVWADVGGVTNAGAVHVWNGGGVPTSAPSASLTVPAALAPLIASGLGQGVRLGDVTGDGILDVVVASSRADVGGVQDTGAVFVFPGGAGLVGALGPQAILAVPGATARDELGVDRGEGLRLADVSGDGVLDVVAPALGADVDGVVDTGAVYVFEVGDAVGMVAPRARLSVPGASSGSRLGYAGGTGLTCIDLTGDGVLDVVSHTTLASPGGVTQAGAIHLFAGGDGLTGAVAPLASLAVPGAAPFDMLGNRLAGPGLEFLDFTGDGTLDVLAPSSVADVNGVVDSGGVYVFAGDAGFAGAQAPVATLFAPEARKSDQLGFLGVTIADVSGDGALDVVAGVRLADRGGLRETGVVYVFDGGRAPTGAVEPSAVLTLPTPVGFTFLDLFQAADVTGDGILDVVAWTYPDREDGELLVYRGGALAGTVWPSARFLAPVKDKAHATGPVLPPRARMFPHLLADLTGDGVLGILAGASDADVNGVSDTGALYLFPVAPDGTAQATRLLRVPGARPGDRLGR